LTPASNKHYVALCGGVGGAKLADGLARILPPSALSLVVNVGDDFDHLSLGISPDLDTVLYTLAGVAHPGQGWGRADESWGVFEELKRLGAEDWFMLGDKDIALHLMRRQMMERGATLGAAMQDLTRRLGVATPILPVTNDPLRTIVQTDEGDMAFQTYFVRRRCQPAVKGLVFDGSSTARLNPDVARALDDPALAGVILCPSNPYLSIAPILAVDDLRARLGRIDAPIIAVSPIIGGAAIKGPAAKIMGELGMEPAADVIADLYADFVDMILVDQADQGLAASKDKIRVAKTLMLTQQDRIQLARTCVDLLDSYHEASPC
jgi:LPPG:FO 2-phospho-L-lactate transferase